MPKKRTAKDQARYYTTAQKSRPSPPSEPSESVKDVTTQLQEMRIMQARERELSRPKVPVDTVIHKPMSLGFTPANYTFEECPPGTLEQQQPTRRIPGPAPPRSWTLPTRDKLRRTSIPLIVHSRTEPVPPFPGLESPDPRSLVHHCLLALGTHFYDHQVYNKYYLQELNIQTKQWLLTYIATRNIGGAITWEGLEVLFPRKREKMDPEEIEHIIQLSRKDEVNVRFLDLCDFLGSGKSTTNEDEIIQHLRTFLSPLDLSDKFINERNWFDISRFPNLTYLSLDISPAHNPKFSRFKLAKVICKHCHRLTHLSLQGVFTSATASSALIYLSRNLLCLEYIDLSRNTALHERYGNPYLSAWDEEPQSFVNAQGGRLLDRLSWDGAWRNVRTLVIKKCRFTKDMENGIRMGIISKRGGTGWIHIITS